MKLSAAGLVLIEIQSAARLPLPLYGLSAAVQGSERPKVATGSNSAADIGSGRRMLMKAATDVRIRRTSDLSELMNSTLQASMGPMARVFRSCAFKHLNGRSADSAPQMLGKSTQIRQEQHHVCRGGCQRSRLLSGRKPRSRTARAFMF